MKRLNTILIILSAVVAALFAAVFFYRFFTMDRTAPQIVSDGLPLTVSVHADREALCGGLTATDNRDGDITDQIMVQNISSLTGGDRAQISYVVFDSASNACTFSREIHYTDYHAPRFTLDAPLIYDVGGTVELLEHLKARDVLDGDISDRIYLTQSDLTTAAEGSYRIQLQAANSMGDASLLNLTVQVQNRTPRHPVLELKDYLVYVPLGEPCSPEDFRDYLKSARQSQDGLRVDPRDVTLTGEVDSSRRGSYDVLFTYTNDKDYTGTVILTVVVD